MPARKRKSHGKQTGGAKSKQAQSSQPKSQTTASQAAAQELEEQKGVEQVQTAVDTTTVLMMSQSQLSGYDTQLSGRHQNLNANNGSLANANYESMMTSYNNTISQMHGDKTVTETTASVSNEGGGIGLQRHARPDDDELGLSQLASAVNQISARSQLQNSAMTDNGSKMMWIEEDDGGQQHLQKTQIFESEADFANMKSHQGGDPAMRSNKKVESQALQYEKVQGGSRDNTFVREEAENSSDQIKLFTPLLLQQLMRNSEQVLSQHKLNGRDKDFAPFEFTESMLEENQAKIDHFIGAHFEEDDNNDGSEPQPVLGLNLLEYFQKSHLVDQLPVEPLPPIENPLEMTQNHEDWVRSQEDFKINLEQLKGLSKPQPGENAFPSELVGDVPPDMFNLDAQQDLDAYTESLKSASSFDNKSWDALTQGPNPQNKERGKIQEQNIHALSYTKNEEEMQKLLEFESGKDQLNLIQSRSEVFSSKDNETESYILKDLEMGENSQSFQVQTFIEHHAQSKKLDTVSHQDNASGDGVEQQRQLLASALESSISQVQDRDSNDNLECFISQPELQQLLQLESSLFNLLQETSITEFMVPNRQGDQFSDDFDSCLEPEAPKFGGSLKNLENYLIRGDLRNCVLCNSKYSEGDPSRNILSNLPRVLYCGDSLCESCITKQIQRASITEKANIRNVAACQLICPVCDHKHIFKLTKTGFLVCNDKYIKVQDEKGPVNFFPSSKINPTTFQLDKDTIHLNLMDNSISIPNQLVIRSLPVNVELLELLKTKRNMRDPSQIELSSIYQEEPGAEEGKGVSSATKAATEEKKGTTDLEEHMSAFNVEEFVREYEKEILQRLSAHDAVRPATSKGELETNTVTGVSVRGHHHHHQDRFSIGTTQVDQHMTADNLLVYPQSPSYQPSSRTQTLLAHHSAADLGRDKVSHNSMGSFNPKLLADLHERFDGKKDNILEEKARRRKELQRKKTMTQVSQQSKPQTFKSHQSSGSAITQTAGANASAQAIFKKKRKRKYQFLKERRDSSYSTSSDELLEYQMRALGAGGSGLFAAATKGAKAGLRPSMDSLSNTFNLGGGDGEEIRTEGMTTKEQIEKLIPLDIEIEKMGPDFEFGLRTKYGKNKALINTVCDRLSDGSDLSPEEIASENTLTRVSMEMLQATHQKTVDLPIPTDAASQQLLINSGVLARDGTNQNGILQQLPNDATLEQKRRKRQALEEKRREKQMQAREIDDQLKKLQEYQKIDSIQTLLSEELKCSSEYRDGGAGLLGATQSSVLPNFDTFVSSLTGQSQITTGQKTQLQVQEDSASKKKARRNKKKRKRQQTLLQQQQLAELMNGHQISESNEADMFTMMVPIEQSVQADLENLKYVLTETDPFSDDKAFFEQDIGTQGYMRANCLTLEPPHPDEEDLQLRISMSCGECSTAEETHMRSLLWYRCDVKSQEKATFRVEHGQSATGNAFQFSKMQLQVLKELVDVGMTNLATHYCETCNADSMAQHGWRDVFKSCFSCITTHRLKNPDHSIVMIMPLQLFTQQLKRSDSMECAARHSIGHLQLNLAERQIANLVPRLQEVLLDKSKDNFRDK